MGTRRLCATLLGLALVSPACGADESPAPAGAPRPPRPDRGAIVGRVKLTGPRPPVDTPRVGPDTTCLEIAGAPPPGEDLVVGDDGAVANAFVYIKDGLDRGQVYDRPATGAALDQRGCRFVPRVVGVQVGQPLEVLNSDPTGHNVHALAVRNAEFNRAQPVQGMRETRVFSSPEVMIRVKCDIHGWMTAYVGVVDHPFFAVTTPDGGFDLPDVPPGQYTVEVWHERLGTQTRRVRVDARRTEPLAFTFAGH
jgi:hypothetical protein